MASTSSASIQKRFSYDVFLSFRGEDTRKNFVDHLYQALHQRGIITYKDDKRIQKGERISDQLIRSIKDSRFLIIIFSKNYATSSWCLDELVQIMECQRTKEQTAYPIFYDVEPTEVRNQSGAVGEAFTKHVEKEGAGRWIDAMKEAADLAGWELKNTGDGHEVQFIQKLVDDISRKPHFGNFSYNEKLVGMKARVEDVLSSLELGSDDVRMIGIKGMGGGGKTTLARAVFDCISIQFEGKSFVENVREGSKGGSGLKDLQQQVLQDVLNDERFIVKSVSEGRNMLRSVMGSKKVLIVFDDVDHISQLEELAGDPTWFKPGSRIIITTRDKHVLVAHQVDFIHDVNLLSHKEAVLLFSRHAFKRESPNRGYEGLLEEVVKYAAGLPLTIEVLGSFLCGRPEDDWEKTIARLKTIPLRETLEKLELSYNGLEDEHKEIFLDVVCMLKNAFRHKALEILGSCGFHAEIGLKVLEEKCLITFSDSGYLHLHDHIEEMGRTIVRRMHPEEPRKHNRLWIKTEIEDILVNDLGTKATGSVKLEHTELQPLIIMKGLRKMKKLRFLHVVSRLGYGYTVAEIDESCKHLPNSIKYLYWPNYPFSCLPKTFQANKLVNLEMIKSKISHVWEGEETKVLISLRFLNLNGSKLRTLDLGMAPNLEMLSLNGCKDFVKLNMPNECPRLKSLDLGGCISLAELHMHDCPHLKSLDLQGCIALAELQMQECPHLKSLHLQGCSALKDLHMNIELPQLQFLNLNYSRLSKLNLGLTPNLEKLYLEDCTDFVELFVPTECPKLEILSLTGSKVCKLNIRLIPNLNQLELSENYKLVQLDLPVECPKLEWFALRGSKVSKLNLGRTPQLKNLYLYRCRHLQEIKAHEGSLKQVDHLNLSVFTNLGYLSIVISDMQHLRVLNLEGDLPELPNNLGSLKALKELAVSMKEVKRLPDSICMLYHLEYLELRSCRLLEQLPEDLGKLECLKTLIILDCIQLRNIPDSICNMRSLTSLSLNHCIQVEKLPEELGRLECLRNLNVQDTDINYLPQSIFLLKDLNIIGSRWLLESYGLTSLKKFFGSNALRWRLAQTCISSGPSGCLSRMV